MPPRPEPVRVADAAAAERLVAETLGRMSALEAALEAESAHVRAGRLREGLAGEAAKAALAGAYLTGLEEVKANAVALARFAPAGIAALREAHRRFAAVLERNQAVLATARSVSEGLLKSLSADLARADQPQGYGRARPMPSPYGAARATPLVLSRSL
ncbi:conserved hypothetical protein [Methylobacterium sp. 4-46]|uniref:hypothetical protein n=1 Tax=unclassified Methylobacterium TaxID=2615210 RepID=UPI000152C031|nr:MULTISPECIES: hypothetical protein [Methylobacterium]ACA18537.1 conserved hypothetical protein [Methylobacterium sp. 4-46]WFT77822.1 hypothetical protein QA634_21245 [Methylobacterium nodulans]